MGMQQLNVKKVIHLVKNLTEKALRYGTRCRGISQFYLHTHAFMHEWNEPYLPLPSQLKLVLIYRPRRNGRLSLLRHHHGE